jgi:hypothetical protein
MLFLAAGCAHQSINHPSAVNVVVTASRDAAQMFGADTFERMMKHELHGATMATPRPLTLTVNIDSTDRLIHGAKESLASGRQVYWRTLFTSAGSSDSVRGGADQASSSSASYGRAYHDPAEYYTAFGGAYQQAHQEPAAYQEPTDDLRRPSRFYSTDASQLVVVGTYTITDESGNVREHEPIVMLGVDPESHDTRAELQSMHAAAQYLADRVASRVKTLNQ